MSERDNATGDESPDADLAAILRDEEFVDALLGDGNVSTSSVQEYELATLIVGARKDVVNTPMPAAPSEDALAAALAEGISESSKSRGAGPHGGRRHRWLTTVTAGAASVAVLLGGIAIAGNYFGTESPTSESSQDIATVAQIRSDLDLAQSLMEKGDRQGSIEVLKSTTKRMGQLKHDNEFSELNARRVHLWSRLTGLPESRAPEAGSDPSAASSEPAPSAPDPAAPEGKAPDASKPRLPQLPQLPSNLPQLPQLPSNLPQLPEIPLPQLPQLPPPPQEQLKQQQLQQLNAPESSEESSTTDPTTEDPTTTTTTQPPTSTSESGSDGYKKDDPRTTGTAKKLSDLDKEEN